MQMRPYGSTGLHVPVPGFGAMQVGDPALDERRAARLFTTAFEQHGHHWEGLV